MSFQKIKEKYLVLICNENGEVGNGMIVGKQLITAGHCVGKEFTCAYTKEGQRIELNHCVVIRNEEKRDDGLFYDFAVFELENIESPLTLACEPVKEEEEYTSLSIEHIIKGGDSSNICLGQEERNPQEVKAKVIQRQGNFFACKMNKRLKPGNSRSPLIKDGKVYGILHGGIEPKGGQERHGKVCVFMAVDAIYENIKNQCI